MKIVTMKLRSGASSTRRSTNNSRRVAAEAAATEARQEAEKVYQNQEAETSRIPDEDLDAAEEDIFHDTVMDLEMLEAARDVFMDAMDEPLAGDPTTAGENPNSQPLFSQDAQLSITPTSQ